MIATRMLRVDEGNVSLAVVSLALVAMVLIASIGDLAIFLAARTKAQTAADASALAAAAEMVPGMGRDPSGEAERFALLNNSSLVSCDCEMGSREATVRVAVPVEFFLLAPLSRPVSAKARAEVDLPGSQGR